MKKITLFTLLFILISLRISAQPASYFEAGKMRINLRSEGKYLSGWAPGFSIGISGLEVSLYAGRFFPKDFPDSTSLRVNGGFWNVGYIWRSAPKPKQKRFHYTIGLGIGGYGINEMNGFQCNLRPGIQINITRNISIAASLYAGYNFQSELDTAYSWNDNSYLSTRKWFANPTVTLRINTSPLAVMGESYSNTAHWGGGTVTQESTTREGDYDVTRKTSYYLPAGEYVTDAIITSTNYINMFGKMLVGTMKNYKGQSLAFGGGVAIRVGLLALDVEYLRGKIGFHQSHTGTANDQWNMRRSSIGVGLNLLNIPFPFKGPSLIRFIIGGRFGKLTLDSQRPTITQGSPNPEELFKGNFGSTYVAFEFGTLGIHFDRFNQKENGYASGIVFGATYLLPIYK